VARPVSEPARTVADGWADVVGQPGAVAELQAATARPVHAYLLLGPRGAGKRAAARAFAAELLAAGQDGADAARTVTLALAERHPDLLVVEPAGRTLRGEEAERIIVEASRSPVEGNRKVIVVDRFHTAEPGAAASLLKTLEEPAPSVVFLLLADDMAPEHVTIASRCVVIAFVPVPDELVEQWLRRLGAEPDEAKAAAAASLGDRRRARLLVTDPAVDNRRRLWASVATRLDGTGFTVAALVDEIQAALDEALHPLEARHGEELAALAEREQQLGTRGSGRKDLEAQQRREKRSLREDELHFGLATLAGAYRDAALQSANAAATLAAIDRLRRAAEALERSPNETLLLQALLLDLPALR
jgi:DNA polymerase-3 subunit delta'